MKILKRLAAVCMGGVLCFSLAACGGAAGDKAYSVGLNGTEIIAGETTAGVLFDAGYTLEALNQETRIGTVPIEASFELDKNSYYTGIKVMKGDESVASIELVTDQKGGAASEAVIGKIKISTELSHPLDTVTFDGVSLPEVTSEVFQEHVSGGEVRDDGTSAYLAGKKYTVRVNYENGAVTELEMSCNYDVDYTG